MGDGTGKEKVERGNQATGWGRGAFLREHMNSGCPGCPVPLCPLTAASRTVSALRPHGPWAQGETYATWESDGSGFKSWLYPWGSCRRPALFVLSRTSPARWVS